MIATARPVNRLRAGRNDRANAEQNAHFQRLREMEIEYIYSPEFGQRQLAAEILRPWESQATDQPVVTPPADTPPYLAALYSIPLLTKEQEFHLFRQMNYHKFLAARLQERLQKRATRSVADEMEQHLAKAEELRNAIVKANLRLVVSIAKTLVDPANSLDELISEGNVPLIRAAEIFDFTRGLRFSTYATWAVRNCLFRCTPKNRKRQYRFLTGASDAFAQWSDPKETVTSSERQWENVQSTVGKLLEELPPRERMIVSARFGLGSEPRTYRFHEIADRLDLSTERVRQLLSRALGQMRNSAEHTLGEVA